LGQLTIFVNENIKLIFHHSTNDMNKKIAKKTFEAAQQKMNDLLRVAFKKGGFDQLTKEETRELNKCTQLIKAFDVILAY
jgi:hypothetical protein